MATKNRFLRKSFPIGENGFNLRKTNLTLLYLEQEPVSEFQIKVINFALRIICKKWKVNIKSVQERMRENVPLQKQFARYLFVHFLIHSMKLEQHAAGVFIRRTKSIIRKIKMDRVSKKMYPGNELAIELENINKEIRKQPWFHQLEKDRPFIKKCDRKIYDFIINAA